MICYIKSMKDFKTIAKYDAVSYSLADGEDGSVTIYEKNPIELTTKYTGCWLIIGDGKPKINSLPYSFSTENDEAGGLVLNITGASLRVHETPLLTGGLEYSINSETFDKKPHVYYISGASPSDDSLTLTIKHPIYAFDRAVYYDRTIKKYGPLIKKILDDDYGVNCTDPEFAMSYMTVVNTDNTNCTVETNNYGYITPSTIFEQARLDGVIINFDITSSNTLSVHISTANYNYGVVVFGDGHSQLETESYDASFCSKCTILQELQEISGVLSEANTDAGHTTLDKVIDFGTASTADDLKAHVEIAQDIQATWATGKVQLMARFYVEWNTMTDGDITFTNNKLDIYLGRNSSGTQLLEAAPEWQRSSEAGAMVTNWFDLSPLTNSQAPGSCELYAVFIVDGSSASPRTNYSAILVKNIIKSSDIKYGPLNGNGDDNPTLFRVLDYYLKTDNTISTTRPSASQRAHGQWQIYECSSSEYPELIALSTFANNSDNHKVEFYSDTLFELYQPMRLRLRGEVLETIITSRVISRMDGRYYYKCGNLAVQLTDHVKASEKEEESKYNEIVDIKSDIQKLQTQGQQTSQRFTRSVDDVEARNISFTNDPWVKIYPPDSFPAGAHIQSISLITWSASEGAFSVMPCGQNSDYAYVIGNLNQSITGLKCRWWYA